MSMAAQPYLMQARRAAQDAQLAAAAPAEPSASRQVFFAVTCGVSWGAIAPIVWSATSPVAAAALLGPMIIAAAIWGR